MRSIDLGGDGDATLVATVATTAAVAIRLLASAGVGGVR